MRSEIDVTVILPEGTVPLWRTFRFHGAPPRIGELVKLEGQSYRVLDVEWELAMTGNTMFPTLRLAEPDPT